jgi:apolipoprotein N-acyltransferase
VGAILAIVANAFVMSLIWWLIHLARRRFMPNLGFISLVVFWISFEYFHFHWDMEWPWLTLGNGFANNIKLVQWFEYTGFLGGSLWILVMNVLLFRLTVLLKIKKGAIDYIYNLTLILLVIFIPVFVSVYLYNNYEEKANPRNIVILQPNVNPYSERYDRAAENEKLQNFIQLAEGVADDSTDFIIGPETVFERAADWNEDYLEFNNQYMRLANWKMNYKNAELVFGVSSSKIYEDKKSAPVTAREYNNRVYDVFNSAVFMGIDGEPQIYHKSILVPGVEKMPFMKYLKFLKDIAIDLGGTSGSLGRQEEPSVFLAKDGTKIGPVICYESAFGEYVTKYVKKGSQLIFIITNDGWWRDTPGYKQHMSFARLRAVETRRSIARSANTGISCFINQRGEVYNATDWWTKTAIKGKLNANDELTFYVKYGDYIARISLFVSVLLLLFLITKGLVKQ